RQRELIVKRVEGELLVYDTERHRAHSLAPLLAALWKRCDGKTTVTALAQALAAELDGDVDVALVWVALERLGEAHLLREPLPAAATARRGTTRRQWLRQASALGLALASITVPTMAEAATTIGTGQCAQRDFRNCGNQPCTQDPTTVCRAV